MPDPKDAVAEKIFSGASDSKLPSNVKPLSLEKRRQWVGAWNSRFRDCKSDGGSADTCESSAFAVANAAIKKEMSEDEMAVFVKDMGELETHKFYMGMIEAWDIYPRQVSQTEAEYSPTGGNADQACSNCRWFVPPGACVVVSGEPDPIVPNGNSNRWEARARIEEEREPLPVRIVEGEAALSGLIHTAKGMIASLGRILKDSADDHREIDPSRQFAIYKDSDGDLRWFAWMSNKWRDRDNPAEIIEEKAHQEYVAWVDKTKNFPEAWLWHTPGTRWGQADVVDYTDGFLVVSGTVDKGMEAVAEAMEGEDLGVSHGFRYRHSDKDRGIIGWYRSFELSPLPPDAAANQWTSMDMIGKEVDMGFNQAKREFLVGKIGEDRVALLENDTKGMRQALEAKGVEWKELEAVDDDVAAAKDGPNVTNIMNISEEASKAIADAAGKAAAEALLETDAFKGMVTSLDEVKASQAQALEDQKTLRDRLVELEKTDDEKVASMIRGKSGRPNGHVASGSAENVVDKDDEDYKPEFKGPTIMDSIMDGLEETEKTE